MKKQRLLVVTDASFLTSGFGIYAKEILRRFHESELYEVAELGCYCTVKNPQIKNIPWKFYPNAVESDDERYKSYTSNNINQFGAWRFNKVCAHFKPDIVLTWTDYWMYSYQETSPFRDYFYWIQMPMVDSAPQKIEWLYTFINADLVIPYTDWAKNTLKKECGKLINMFDEPANAGINPEDFYPIQNKTNHKKSMLGFDAEIVGCVMRNQKRKLFSDVMLAFRNYLNILYENNNIEKLNKTYLYLHTSFPEVNGWDLPSLLIEYGLLDKTYFTYSCRSCGNCFPSKFKGAVTFCSRCKKNAAFFPNVSNGISTNNLNKIYNLFDILIQNSIAEGFGIPQLEAAACGVPFASVDYSAMSEIVRNLKGFIIPVQRYFREMETNAERVYPYNENITEIIYNYFNKMSLEERQNLSKTTRELCISKYTWNNVFSVWKKCCDNIAELTNKNSKLCWSKDKQLKTNHSNVKVPKNLDFKEFVEYICKYVLCEPNFKNTALAKSLIRDLSSQLIAKNGILQTFNHNNVISILESYLNNKIVCSEIMNSIETNKEDFIVCQNQ